MSMPDAEIAKARIGHGEAILAIARPSVDAWRSRNGLVQAMARGRRLAWLAWSVTRFAAAGVTALMIAQTLWSPLAPDAFVDWASGGWVLVLGSLAIWRWNLKRVSAFEGVSGLMRRTLFVLTRDAVYVIVEGGVTDRYEMVTFKQAEVQTRYERGEGDVAFRRSDGEALVLPAIPDPAGFLSILGMRA